MFDMYDKHLFSIILFLFQYYILFVNTQCPSIEPCLCIENKNSSDNQTILYSVRTETIVIHSKSIICEHINESSFDLRSVLNQLNTILITTNQSLIFNDFLLYNTQIQYLPNNLFGNLTFSYINLYHNPLLTSIDINTFDNTQNTIEIFRTLNTNLSETIFPIIKKFHSLKILSMENDSIQSIPDYTFNHTQLRYIWLGNHYKKTFQPLIHIGKYPFYYLPKLIAIQIFSPLLKIISKYSFSMNQQLESNAYELDSMLYIEIAGLMINSLSFESTSLTRFNNRPVFLRLFNTSIDYIDENIFQPFLESNRFTLLDIQHSPISQICDYRSKWIKDDYCTNINTYDNRVYGSACCH